MLLFLFISLILCSSEVAETNYSSNEIMEQIRDGKKFSEIVDTSIFQQFTEFHGDRFIDLLNNINIPKRSCYNEILYKLKFDCEKANEEQQRILALHFTQCYYNITGKLHLFPTDTIDQLKISSMSQPVYSVYTLMKSHWKNLCQFSKQNIFTEETSHSLIDLYQSIIESMNSILSLKKELKETSQFFNDSFTNMTIQINKTSKNIEEIQALFESFSGYFDSIHKFINYASSILNQMKFFSLVIIIALFFAMYIPKMLVPVTILTIIFGCLDRFLGNHLSNWDNSFYRQILKYTYALTCFSYPAFLIFKYIISLFKFILSLSKNENDVHNSKDNKDDNKYKQRANRNKDNNNKNETKDKNNKGKNRNRSKDLNANDEHDDIDNRDENSQKKKKISK